MGSRSPPPPPPVARQIVDSHSCAPAASTGPGPPDHPILFRPRLDLAWPVRLLFHILGHQPLQQSGVRFDGFPLARGAPPSPSRPSSAPVARAGPSASTTAGVVSGYPSPSSLLPSDCSAANRRPASRSLPPTG